MSEALDAVQATLKDREAEYGGFKEMHELIAEYWTTYLDVEVKPSDVAQMMVLFKIARASHGEGDKSADDLLDSVGYAVFASELRRLEKREEGYFVSVVTPAEAKELQNWEEVDVKLDDFINDLRGK